MQDRLARGFVLFTLASLILVAGFVGYLKYDEYVAPNMRIFVCCVPASVVAAVLMFFGIASRWTVVRRTSYQPLRSGTAYTDKTSPTSTAKKSGDELEKKTEAHHGARKIHKRELVDSSEVSADSGKLDYSTFTQKDFEAKRKSLQEYMENLSEQYKEGLLMDETYQMLKQKYQAEQSELEKQQKLRKKSSRKEK
jgi:hypothetical protein